MKIKGTIMKKIILFITTMLFAVSVNAASINLANAGGTSGGFSGNGSSQVLSSGFLYDTTNGTRPWAAKFDLNVTSDTSVNLAVSLNPETDLVWDLFKVKNGSSIVEEFAILSGGSSGNVSTGSFFALAVDTYRIVIRSQITKGYNLTASAVPVPTALFLFAPALLGFFGLRRKAALAA